MKEGKRVPKRGESCGIWFSEVVKSIWLIGLHEIKTNVNQKKKKKSKRQPVRENRGGKKRHCKSITLEINNTTIVNIPHRKNTNQLFYL